MKYRVEKALGVVCWAALMLALASNHQVNEPAGVTAGVVNAIDAVVVTETLEEDGELELSLHGYNYKDYLTLGQYEGFRIAVPSTEVTDEEIEKELTALVEQNMVYKAVDRDKVELGDYVNVSYETVVKETGATVDDWTSDAVEMRVENGSLPDDFIKAIIGMTKGEDKIIEYVVSEDYSDEVAAGQAIEQKITIHSIDECQVPTVTDEWIAEVTGEESIAAWKEAMRSKLKTLKESEREEVFYAGVINAIESSCAYEGSPEELVSSVMDDYRRLDTKAAEKSDLSLEEYAQAYFGYNGVDEYEEDLRRYVENVIYETFLVQALCDVTETTVTDAEVDAFAEENELRGYFSQQEIHDQCLADKVMQAILKKSTMYTEGT